MVKEIGFGIIGCGIAAKWHVEAAMTGCGTRLVGVFDANADRAAEFASKYNCQAFLSAEELVASDDIDIVCICVPSGLHAKYSVMAANACKHIIVEKPLAMTVEQIEAVTSACERNKVQGTVISQLRFTPAVVAVKRAIDEGRLGRLILGDMKMKYYRSSEYYKSAAWRGRRDMDGGAVMNQGIHGIDLLLHLMGPISSVSGFSKTLIHDIEAEDYGIAEMAYENGLIARLSATTSYPASSWYTRIEVYGDKGAYLLTAGGPEGDHVYWWQEGKWTEESPYPVKREWNQAADNFANALRTGAPLTVTAENGIRSRYVLDKLYESAAEGKGWLEI